MEEKKPIEMNEKLVKKKLEELLNDLNDLIPKEANYRLAKKEFLKYIHIAEKYKVDVKRFQDKYQEIIKRREEK